MAILVSKLQYFFETQDAGFSAGTLPANSPPFLQKFSKNMVFSFKTFYFCSRFGDEVRH